MAKTKAKAEEIKAEEAKAEETEAEETKTENTAPRYRKDQILRSTKYLKRRDLLSVLLNDATMYTITEVDTAIENYLKGGKK